MRRWDGGQERKGLNDGKKIKEKRDGGVEEELERKRRREGKEEKEGLGRETGKILMEGRKGR